MIASSSIDRLRALAPGRHYGGSREGWGWIMVGRSLVEVEEWSMVPPAASLTLAWGEGGCRLTYEGGELDVGPGDWMWVDAGFAHRGRNDPGSDFLTLFIAPKLVEAAALDVAPIGASVEVAPETLANTLALVAVMLLEGTADGAEARPALDVILDHVADSFSPWTAPLPEDEIVRIARARLIADPRDNLQLGEIAEQLGVSGSELSRRFKARYHLTPVAYRRQLRLVAATRAVLDGATLAAAASEGGFADAAHFSRTFREQYGVTPSRWARRVGAPRP